MRVFSIHQCIHSRSVDKNLTVLTLASAEIYDPVAGTWSPTASMTTARQSHTATTLPNGTVLVVGGEKINEGNALASAEIYDDLL